MKNVIHTLKQQGFKVVGTTSDAVYMQRGADHRVIDSKGTVKRGSPAYRGK